MAYPNCTQCKRDFEVGDSIVLFNDNEYHEFCVAVASHEVDLGIAERNRKQKLFDENPWLWEFQKNFEEWTQKNSNPNHETKYYTT